jgi:hypothetical protein
MDITLNEYEATNLRWLLDVVMTVPTYPNLNTGDWVYMVRHKLPEAGRPNVTMETIIEQAAIYKKLIDRGWDLQSKK